MPCNLGQNVAPKSSANGESVTAPERLAACQLPSRLSGNWHALRLTLRVDFPESSTPAVS